MFSTKGRVPAISLKIPDLISLGLAAVTYFPIADLKLVLSGDLFKTLVVNSDSFLISEFIKAAASS